MTGRTVWCQTQGKRHQQNGRQADGGTAPEATRDTRLTWHSHIWQVASAERRCQMPSQGKNLPGRKEILPIAHYISLTAHYISFTAPALPACTAWAWLSETETSLETDKNKTHLLCPHPLSLAECPSPGCLRLHHKLSLPRAGVGQQHCEGGEAGGCIQQPQLKPAT